MNCSIDQHAITIAEETIPFLDRLSIGFEHEFLSRQSTDEHQQRRLREVKVGQQRIDHLEVVGRIDKNVRLSLLRLEPGFANCFSAGLEDSHDGCTNRNHTLGILDYFHRLRAEGIPL